MKKVWILTVVALIASVPQVWTQIQAQSVSKQKIFPADGKIWPVQTVSTDTSGRIFIGGNIFSAPPRARTSIDSGQTWPGDGGSDPYADVRKFVFVDSGYVLAGTDDGVYRSKNYQSWQRVFQPEKNGWASALLVAKNGSIFAGFDKAIYRSMDNGNSWMRVADSTTAYPYIHAFTQTPSGVILAGCQSGLVNTANGVLRSTDNGESWALSNAGLPLTKGKINIREMVSGPNNIYLLTEYDGAFVSNDEGLNWNKIKSIPDRPFSGGAAYICANVLGVFIGFESWDANGETFYRSPDGSDNFLPVPGIKDPIGAIAQLSPTILIVSTGTGLYKVTFTGITAVEELPGLPTAFILSQNYPNPFNPSTTIEFALPERSVVNLVIYNMIGQKIETLVSGELNAGYHRIVWSARDFPSGVYLYRLQCQSIDLRSQYMQTKRMLLVK